MKHPLPERERQEYMGGTKNTLIRLYYYLENGLNILNEFRNLFLGVIAIYIALHLTNVLWMVLMFIPCLIILTIVGYYAVHSVARVKEWLNLRFATHFGIRTFDYTQATYEILKEVLEELKKKNGNT